MSSCDLCPRTAPDGAHLCLVHSGELRGWLTEIPAQARLLQEEFIEPGGRPSQGRLGGTGRADAPVPVDLRVLVLLGAGRFDAVPGTDDDGTPPIAAVLGAWAGHIAYHYPAAARDPYGTARTQPCEQACPTQGETINGWCAWLAAYLPFTLTLPLAAELHRALGDLVRRLRALTHSEPHDDRRAASCPSCKAFALVRTDGRWHIHCLACGHQMTPDEYDQHAARYLADHQAATGHPREDLSMTTDRVPVRVLLTIGDQAEVVADVPAEERSEPQRYPAAEIADATGLPVGKLSGARLTAAVGDDDKLTDWQQA